MLCLFIEYLSTRYVYEVPAAGPCRALDCQGLPAFSSSIDRMFRPLRARLAPVFIIDISPLQDRGGWPPCLPWRQQSPQLPPFDHTPAPYDGPSKEEVHALRKQYLSPGEARLTDGIPGQAVHCLPALSYFWCLLELTHWQCPIGAVLWPKACILTNIFAPFTADRL